MTIQTVDQPDVVAVPLAELRVAMSHMPYAGGLTLGRTDLDGESLLSWLAALAARLGRAGEEARARTEELSELRRQRDAIRAFLGTVAE